MNSLSILVIDDDPTVRRQMMEFFRISGYTCFGEENTEQTLKTLKSQSIDILIVNLQMQNTDGLVLIDQIKKNFDVDVIALMMYSGDYTYEFVVSKGASDFITKPIRYPELLLRVRRLANERILRHERDEMIERLKVLSITDDLTQLYNSRHFHRQIQIEVERANRYHHPLSLLMIDIDWFKSFNDRFGHIKGDAALTHVGTLLKTCLRSMDSAFRYGGEEFAVILPVTTGEEAMVAAERIRSKLETTPVLFEDGTGAVLTLSIGVSDLNRGENENQLIERADQALYQSKENGRNRITCFRTQTIPASA